ncbi:unnamed protein product [Caenorhabditis sp. 36 PRJEB53466]|nr:unnamed protein product [Caenorhabditis sp. 36 PRJEB53466]
MSSAVPIADCSQMEAFATSQVLRLSLSLNLIISIVAIPVLGKSIHFIASRDVFHINTRLQILVHLLALLIHSVGRVGLHSMDLFNYLRYHDSACDIIPNFYRCFIFRGFYNAGLALSSMCSTALVLERIAAFRYSQSYEHCQAGFGVLLAFLQFFLAACYLFSMYFHAAFVPGNFTLYYCQTIASSFGSIWFVIGPLYAVMLAQIVSRIMFYVLMRKSKNLRSKVSLTLSNRFNLDQSLRSLRALKLLVNCNFIVFIILSIVTTTLHFNSYQLTKPHYMALVEAVHILPVYGIAVSIGVYSKLQSLTTTQSRALVKAIHTKSDSYFDQLRKQME